MQHPFYFKVRFKNKVTKINCFKPCWNVWNTKEYAIAEWGGDSNGELKHFRNNRAEVAVAPFAEDKTYRLGVWAQLMAIVNVSLERFNHVSVKSP